MAIALGLRPLKLAFFLFALPVGALALAILLVLRAPAEGSARADPDRTGADWAQADWTGTDWTGTDWTGSDGTRSDGTRSDGTRSDRHRPQRNGRSDPRGHIGGDLRASWRGNRQTGNE